ncbi:hypothetical protein [Sphingobacterium sp. SGR-19]|uniref:hypothetical protein n=1 Tax=Sphingobacterium sp. SGR-19 TaxID=2710886 RepID=UPI0013EB9E94|nr:hypothetical protein [Sphingobacterium sp. SGR-19]NGM65809.1 hypothetical protein [Sphingobacterium sp. SGR-19]
MVFKRIVGDTFSRYYRIHHREVAHLGACFERAYFRGNWTNWFFSTIEVIDHNTLKPAMAQFLSRCRYVF